MVVDYCRHADEELRERQADVWMGFDATELVQHARASGFDHASVLEIPRGYVKRSSDGKVGWQVLSATRAARTKTKAAPPIPEGEASSSPRLRKQA